MKRRCFARCVWEWQDVHDVAIWRIDEKDLQNVVLLRNYGVNEDEDVQNTSIMQG